MHKYFNPKKIDRFIERYLWLFVSLAICCFGVGIYYALFNSPADYQQGEMVRVMYVHVPAAWLALSCYLLMALFSGAEIIWRSPVSSLIAISIAPIGACFTLVCLVTGSLWGMPIWGTWWVWDARLTSVLILFFLYLGYMALYNAYDDKKRGAKVAGILAIFGSINIPIIKFSVDWWNSLHQKASIFRQGGVAIDPSMLRPLLIMFAGYSFLFIVIALIRVRTKLLQNKIEILEYQILK